MRLFISAPSGSAWEVLVMDLKWYDTRAGKGGGGGIELVMYLLGVDFLTAVASTCSTLGFSARTQDGIPKV